MVLLCSHKIEDFITQTLTVSVELIFWIFASYFFILYLPLFAKIETFTLLPGTTTDDS